MKVTISREDWLLTMQKQDPKLQEIYNILTTENNNPENQNIINNYELKHERLYRRTDDGLRWAVPADIRWRILKSVHDDIGHFALERVLTELKKHYWFPRMRNYAKRYIASCTECAYYKVTGGKREGKLHIIERVPIPFDTVHIDHMGPFPRGSNGNIYVLVLIDGFTKYVQLRATKNTKTRPVIKFLNETIATFGTPRRLVSDQGTAFSSKSFGTYCRENDIKHIKNATATPRANGQVERTNRTLKSAIATMTANATEMQWDDHLRAIQWGMNSLENKTTRKSPHQLLFDYTPRNALQNKVLLALEEISEEERPLSEIREEAKEAIRKNQQEQKIRFDARRKEARKYDIGDMVLVEREAVASGDSRKLTPKYKGPYMVTAKFDHDRYLLEDIPGAQRTQRPFKSIFAPDRMKPWCSLPAETNEEDEEEGNHSDEQDVPEDGDDGQYGRTVSQNEENETGNAI